jgi:putative holliday junction resolvase
MLILRLDSNYQTLILIMGRILAIDYGQKRVGLAVTDNMKLIANGLTTVHVKDIWVFLDKYLTTEDVDMVVIGEPMDMQGNPSDSTRFIQPFVNKFQRKYPDVEVKRFDERFTSKMAFDTMIAGGLSKSKRKDKALVDKISATLILQSFMDSLC